MVYMKNICSVSFGKDSLAMLLVMIERNYPIDEVVFYNNGMEFQSIYDTRDKILPILSKNGIEFTEVKPKYEFLYHMFEKPINGKNGIHYGMSWCGGVCRWGTREKISAINRHIDYKDSLVYVGIAADETERLSKEVKPYKRFPLVDLEMTEQDCLKLCYDNGFFWEESTPNGTIKLYDILSRVSCWCCSNKNLKELKNIYLYLPEYWEKLKYLQSKTDRPMKGVGKSVFELEDRFRKELEN